MLGQYRPVDSMLHRVDARAKLFPVVLVMVLALLKASLLFHLLVVALVLAALTASGVGAGTLVRAFRPVLLLVIITVLYHLIFSGGGTRVVWDLPLVPVTSGGIRMAAYFSLRLLLFISAAFLVTLTTSPSELAESVVFLLSPLKRLRVPVNDLGLIVFIAMRFIPVLYEEFTAIRNAQVMRGVEFDGSIWKRLRQSTSILLPVFIAAISRADDLALALQARGYRSGAERSVYTHHRFGRRDGQFMLGTSLLSLALYFATRQ